MIAIPNYIDPDEYLIIDRDSPTRHEYHHGLVYAMAGGSDNHDRIAFNFSQETDDHLGDSPCRFYTGDVTVNCADEFYYYPGAIVTSDRHDHDDRYTKLIAEVL